MRWHSWIHVCIELTCSALWLTLEEDTELQGMIAMPSLREEYEDVRSRLSHLDRRERSARAYGIFSKKLDSLDAKLQRAALPPDERVELTKLSDHVRGVLDRRLRDLQHPTVWSPQLLPERPERGWGFGGFDRSR
ncbi:hypothetical protein [Nocardia nova]|jgi:hypothetical protein|uniref:hypothetical protein n=1 Tax=Nocardia nova TaxID=37330 RepID=UPI00189405C1|nr:hypothetical protein [Nocardia nova]MBF6149606.1 hypothetical protein [Nocardia nova]MDN2498969.1 hypothetical protein [Nocardia nova]